MRTGTSITLKRSHRHRLEALAQDRNNTRHKRVRRVEIVLLSADSIDQRDRCARRAAVKWKPEIVIGLLEKDVNTIVALFRTASDRSSTHI
jgi:hypothetical protein